MKSVILKKGLDLTLEGKASKQVLELPVEGIYGIRPDNFRGIKPRPLVKPGDSVEVGSPIFCNKENQRQLFCSPVSGTVVDVERGERRKIEYIKIQADGKQTAKDFDVKNPELLNAEQVVDILCETGLLFGIRKRPYDIIATPDDMPRSIFCSAFNKMPLAAELDFILSKNLDAFQMGVNALARIAPFHLGISPEEKDVLGSVQNAETVVFDGPNPSGNVGVQINHVSPINKGETVWTIAPEEVIAIGRLFKNGQNDLRRTFALAGSEIISPQYYTAPLGAPLDSLLKSQLKTEEHVRIISGNPFVGTVVSSVCYLAAFATEITAIPEGDDIHELLGWISPRLKQFSANRSYFSWLHKNKTYNLDARIKGGGRHMIMSGEYDRVFPMDIFPEYLIKAILSGDIEKMEQLGIYEVAPEDFAVAEFVDSSKLNLQRIVREGLDMLRKENE